jgi:hypothetical protein
LELELEDELEEDLDDFEREERLLEDLLGEGARAPRSSAAGTGFIFFLFLERVRFLRGTFLMSSSSPPVRPRLCFVDHGPCKLFWTRKT